MKPIPALLVLTMAAANAASAATVLFDLQGKAGFGLLSGNENHTINGTPGTGGEIGAGISYDTDSNLLTINVGWGTGNGFLNLTANASAAHIHGSTTSGGTASFTQNAGVLLDLNGNGYTFNTSASGGSITGVNSVAFSETQEAALLAGRWYINVHTPSPNNPSGEIRGNLVVVPEPGTLALAAIGIGALALTARRRMAR